jgi:FtsP/CotA-like multicopper oxidase with cupredoxin domain
MSPPQHWHGLLQKNTNYADGGDSVNQCPIIPDESFLYNFTVPDQAVFLLAMFVGCRQAHVHGFRGRSGITVTSRPNTVMDCVVL